MGLTLTGLGSGLDISSLVTQLMTAERQPLTALATREASFQAKLSAFGQLKGSLSALQTAAKGLNDATKFSATTPSVSADSGFSATSTSAAAVGNHAIEVFDLAKTQRVSSNAITEFAPADGSVTPRTLEIQFGKVTAGVFVGEEELDENEVSVPKINTLEFTGSTLEELRDAINSGDMGVSASIIFNGSAKQLVLNGKDGGAEKAFSIGGDVGLSYDPANPAGSSSTTQIQTAQNARFNVDGITIERATNTISDVLDGVTLTLTKGGINGEGVSGSLTISQDTSTARAAIDAFVKAYNDVNNTIKGLTNYDAENKKASTLTGDATARGAQTQIRNLMGAALSGLGSTSRLSELGITMQREGGLAIDSTKLDAALRDPTRDVAAFFTGNGSVKGFAETISAGLAGYVDSDGLINGRTDGISASIKSIGTQRTALNLRMESIEARYRAQFTALDVAMASMSQTSDYLAQQLASLPTMNS